MKQSDKSAVKKTIMTSLITAFCLLGDSMLYVVLPLYYKLFGLESLWQVGVLLSVNRIIRLPFNPIALWLFKIIGQRKCIYIAIVLAFITTLSYSLLNGFFYLLLMRSIWGISWNFLRLGTYFSILDHVPSQERGRHMGIYNGVFRLGSLFGMLGGAIIAEKFNPLSAGYAFSFFAFLAFPLAVFFISDKKVEGDSSKKENIFKLFFEEKIVTILLLTSFFSALVYQGILTSMISYLIGYIKLDISFFSAIGFGAASIAGFLQALRWTWEPWLAPRIGKLSDGKRGRRFFLKTFFGMAALMFFAVSFSMPPILWLSLFIFIQFTGTGITTLVDVAATDIALAKKDYPAVMGAHSFFIDLGSALGPTLGYLLNDYMNIHAPFILAGILLLFISILWINVKDNLVK